MAGLLATPSNALAASGFFDGFFAAPGQSTFVGAQTVSAPTLDDRLARAGFPGIPDTVWTVGGTRDWQVGGLASPFRAGIQGALALGEEATAPKRVRVTQAYLGPRVAYHICPNPRFSAEMAVGVGVGVTAVTLVHADTSTLQASLSQGYEATLWRAGLVAAPELIVGVSVMDGLSVELGMAYQYDIGLGGWRNSAGASLSDAPKEGLNGLRYRLGVTWGRATSPEAPDEDAAAQPWTTVLGLTIVSVDAPTASRLRLPDQRGAHVIRVAPGSPAATAGLLEDDIIRRIGSVDVLSAQHFLQELASYRPGDVVPLRVWRVESIAPLIRRGILVDVLFQLPAP